MRSGTRWPDGGIPSGVSLVVESPFASFEELEREALACTKCPLATQGRSQVVFGDGDPAADLVFVGEGPGAEEDKQGIPFVGRAGRLLTGLIADIGLHRDEVYIANVVKCRPPGNRDPLPDEIATCRPFLEAQIEAIAPDVIVTLGNFASKLLLDTTEGITRLRGHVYPFATGVLVPTYHPAAILRGGGVKLAAMRADFVRAKESLAGARAVRGRLGRSASR